MRLWEVTGYIQTIQENKFEKRTLRQPHRDGDEPSREEGEDVFYPARMSSSLSLTAKLTAS